MAVRLVSMTSFGPSVSKIDGPSTRNGRNPAVSVSLKAHKGEQFVGRNGITLVERNGARRE